MASILLKVVRIFNTQLKCNYLKNKKLFLIFVFDFWILHQILNILKEKMIVIANVFLKLHTVKIFVRKRSQEHRFRTGFGSQHVKVSELLAKSSWECFDHIFFIILSEVDLENVSPSVSRNLRGVCENNWHPKSSILFKVVRIWNSQLKCNCVKNENVLLKFLLHC